MRRLLLPVVLAGCTAGGAADWDGAAIQSSFEAAQLIVPAMNALDGVAASRAVSSLASAASRVVSPSLMSELHAGVVGLEERPAADTVVDERRCSAGQCAFKYEWTQTLYHSVAFSGTISRTAETATVKFTSSDRFRDLVGAESSINGAVTASEATLDGSLSVSATAFDKSSLPEHQATVTIFVKFDQVTFDADHCGTGGIVTATVDYAASGGPRYASEASWDARFVLSGSDTVTCP